MKKREKPNIKIQQQIYSTLLVMAFVMTVVIAIVSIAINVSEERKRLDQNLENVAQAVAKNQTVYAGVKQPYKEKVLCGYLDSLQETLSNIDVISVIDSNRVRLYHTNKKFIGTKYDGTLPDFEKEGNGLYVTNDIGPSGSQRRAYAAVYDRDGNYVGFVLAVMLKQNVNRIIIDVVRVHLLCAVIIMIFAFLLSKQLSFKIKRTLKGYEPDTFSAMFSVRDNVLESLEEGIVALDASEEVVYTNEAAKRMLEKAGQIQEKISVLPILKQGEKLFGEAIDTNIVADLMPVLEQEKIVGVLCILRDRTEYTKLMEDLSGVRYMVDSMRANNHDFINQLHVILGLIQMGETKKACEYITNITSIQQTLLHNIIQNIKDPSVAALLIGKYARAAELDIRFSVEQGSQLSRKDISLPSGDLVTIIGNLIDNAMDAMNQKDDPPKELTISIFTKPHAMWVHVDDTGVGISKENLDKVLENGFSTKGDSRGTGMYVASKLIEKYGGTISIDSEEGIGTSIAVTLTDEGGKAHV